MNGTSVASPIEVRAFVHVLIKHARRTDGERKIRTIKFRDLNWQRRYIFIFMVHRARLTFPLYDYLTPKLLRNVCTSHFHYRYTHFTYGRSRAIVRAGL